MSCDFSPYFLARVSIEQSSQDSRKPYSSKIGVVLGYFRRISRMVIPARMRSSNRTVAAPLEW